MRRSPLLLWCLPFWGLAAPACAAQTPWAERPLGWTIAGLLVALWLVVAVWALVRSVQDRSEKRAAENWGVRLHALLGSTPQAYLVIEPTGAVHSSDQLRGWLGLSGAIQSLHDLAPQPGTGEDEAGCGLAGPDFDALMDDIKSLQTAGQAFMRTLGTEAGSVRLQVTGRLLAHEALLNGGNSQPAVALWFSDITFSADHSEKLIEERGQLLQALDAASGLIERAPFPAWLRDRSMALWQVNSAYVQAVECTTGADVIARQVELVTNPVGPAARAYAAQARELKATQVHEESVIIGGVQRRLRFYDVPLEGVGVGGFAVDMSESEAIRDEFERFTRAQRDMIDSLSTPVLFFGPDQRMTFSNAALGKLFNLDAGWLAEKPSHSDFLDKLRDLRRIPEQVDYRSWRQKQLAIYGDISNRRDELWYLPDERALRVVTQPHPQGGLQIVIEDVTQQLSLERSVNTLSKVQSVTLNNLHEGVALVQSDGHLRLSNRALADMLGLDRDWLDAEPDIDIAINRARHLMGNSDQRQSLQAQIRAMVNGRRPVSGELVLDNQQIVTFSGTPLPDGSALLTLIDITDGRTKQRALEQSNAALEEFNDLRSRFIENTSYELRTPLTSIIGFSEMLEQGFLGPLEPRQRDYMRDILKSSQKLDALIGDLLDLTLLGSGSVSIERQDHDIIALLQDVVRDAQAAADAKSQQLTLDVSVFPQQNVRIVEMDAGRMRQAISKVLDNAIAYTQPHGTVTVTGTVDARDLVIAVTDNGPGISPADQAHVFEVFRQGSNAGQRSGVGLGLSLVRHIMDAHGGSVTLQSALGSGTQVQLRLPRGVIFNSPQITGLFE